MRARLQSHRRLNKVNIPPFLLNCSPVATSTSRVGLRLPRSSMMRNFVKGGVALVFFAISSAHAQTTSDTGGTVLSGVYDKSNATQAPGYCQVTVPASATSLSTMLASGLGGSCAVPNWAVWAYFLPRAAGNPVAVECVADSTALSATLGWPIQGYQAFPMPGSVRAGAPFSTTKCVSATGTPVTMDIWWMG